MTLSKATQSHQPDQTRNPHPHRSVVFSLRRRAQLALRLRSLATALPMPAPTQNNHAPSGHNLTAAPVTASRVNREHRASTPQIFLRIPLPVATQLIISNRSACRLELPESYRKQTTGTRSNRHKCSVYFPTCSPPPSWKSRQRASSTHSPIDSSIPLRLCFA
jgi:hypothetical protein